MWRTGLEPQPLRGWVGVALSLATNDVVLNALGRARFCEVWWASLMKRGDRPGESPLISGDAQT
jgi:hypothetical protein